jgi:hypothetical protein
MLNSLDRTVVRIFVRDGHISGENSQCFHSKHGFASYIQISYIKIYTLIFICEDSRSMYQNFLQVM